MQDHRSDVLFGMDGFSVLAANEAGGDVQILVELKRPEGPCPSCGTFSSSSPIKEFPVVRLAAPSGTTGEGVLARAPVALRGGVL